MDRNRGGVNAVGGIVKRVTGSVTRPNDTNAYTAGDAVTDSTSAPTKITFSSVGRMNGGHGLINKVYVISSANQAVKPDLELWLFNASVTPDNDNAVFTPTDAECLTLVGIFQFRNTEFFVGDATVGDGGNSVCFAVQENILFECASGDDDLYGLVVVRNAYTPVAQGSFTFVLKVVQD